MNSPATNIPHVSVTFRDSKVTVIIPDNCCVLLSMELEEVVEPFIGSAVRSWTLDVITRHVDSWLRFQVHTGKLRYCHLTGTWRYLL